MKKKQQKKPINLQTFIQMLNLRRKKLFNQTIFSLDATLRKGSVYPH